VRWVSLGALLWSCVGFAQTKLTLVATEPVAKQVLEIQMGLLAETAKLSDATRERRLLRIKSLVTDYVVHQLEAEPRMEWWLLRQQLVRVRNQRMSLHTCLKYRAPTPNVREFGPSHTGLRRSTG